MIWATVGAEFFQECSISAQERKGTWVAPTVRQTVMKKSTILINRHFFLQLHGLHRPELPEIPCKNALYPVMSDAVTFKYEEARGRWDLVRWSQLEKTTMTTIRTMMQTIIMMERPLHNPVYEYQWQDLKTPRFAIASRDIVVGEVLCVEKAIVSHMLPEYMVIKNDVDVEFVVWQQELK